MKPLDNEPIRRAAASRQTLAELGPLRSAWQRAASERDRLLLAARAGIGTLAARALARPEVAAPLLAVLALATRLPLLSVSLDEGDSANFYNALKHGYNLNVNWPHAPGYPVYVFMGWLLDSVLSDPLLSLTLLSALTGALAVFPFYLLLRQLVEPALAMVGSLLFIVNPLAWSFSETALSDAPSLFFVTLTGWLAYTGRKSNAAFYSSFVVMSLAIGVRQANIALLVLLAFPVGYRLLATGRREWTSALVGVGLFLATCTAWFVPSVYLGSGGFDEYFDSVSSQWSVGVRVTDVMHLPSPWPPNLLLRLERFALGYLVTYPWTGSDDKVIGTVLLVAPWVVGIALFIMAFRLRSPPHLFVLIWLSSLLYPMLAIHFLPRYALPQLPAFIVACIMGYRFLANHLVAHPLRFEVLTALAMGSVLALYGIKYQAPVGSFESSAPALLVDGFVFIALAALVVFAGRWMAQRGRTGFEAVRARPRYGRSGSFSYAALVVVFLALLVIPYGIKGYSLASIAHRSPSPSQRLADYATANFEISRRTACWGLQTQYIFGASTPSGFPQGFASIADLTAGYEAGSTLVVSDRCRWYEEISETLGVTPVARFEGRSPVWSKAPSIGLYAASSTRAGP